jgi:hypothetical protein
MEVETNIVWFFLVKRTFNLGFDACLFKGYLGMGPNSSNFENNLAFSSNSKTGFNFTYTIQFYLMLEII